MEIELVKWRTAHREMEMVWVRSTFGFFFRADMHYERADMFCLLVFTDFFLHLCCKLAQTGFRHS